MRTETLFRSRRSRWSWYAAGAALLLAGVARLPPQAAPAILHQPYLQQVSSGAATIVWSTLSSGRAEVRFGPPGGARSTVVAASTRYAAASTGLASDYYQHVATLTGLSASTTYEYDILVNGLDVNAAADSLRTAPPAGTGTVSFVAFGDSGTGSSQQQQVAARLDAAAFDFAMHAGDIAYANSSGTGPASHQTMTDWFFTPYRNWLRKRPVFPSMGNHDSRSTNADGRPYRDLYVLSEVGGSGGFPDHAERYYSFDYGPVHVIVLDTEFAFLDAARLDAQLAWAEADLSATTQPWKIALYHRSPYSAGGENGSEIPVRNVFGPLFDRHGVQLSISAHEHDYERTVPLRDTQPDPSGTVYIATGGGGAPLYPAGTAYWTARSASVNHYVKGTADACSLRIDAIDVAGTTFDSVTLNRCGTPPPPPPPTGPSLGEGDILLYAADATRLVGNWVFQNDATAAGGRVLRNPDRGAAKRTVASAAPADYVELAFDVQANVPYRLWMRAKADGDVYYNDSVFVQFSGATDYAIGTTAAAEYNLEDCSGCRLSGWGWQDNGWGVGVLGPLVTFTSGGTHTIRIQPREDGLAIDQVLLSPSKFTTAPPGALKNDTTIYPRSSAGSPSPPPPPPPSSSWNARDIGAVGVAGRSTGNDSAFTLSGSGADVWGTADALHYVSQSVTGDFDVVARVSSVEYVHAWTKAGVMVRATVSADSTQAFMLASPGKGLAFQRRVSTAGLSTHTTGGGGTAPVWVKLARRANVVSAFHSADGVTWTAVGQDTFTLPATVFVGLAVSSHDNTRLATAAFDNVSITPR